MTTAKQNELIKYAIVNNLEKLAGTDQMLLRIIKELVRRVEVLEAKVAAK